MYAFSNEDLAGVGPSWRDAIAQATSAGLSNAEINSRLASYDASHGTGGSDWNWWGTEAIKRVLGLTADPSTERAQQNQIASTFEQANKGNDGFLGFLDNAAPYLAAAAFTGGIAATAGGAFGATATAPAAAADASLNAYGAALDSFYSTEGAAAAGASLAPAATAKTGLSALQLANQAITAANTAARATVAAKAFSDPRPPQSVANPLTSAGQASPITLNVGAPGRQFVPGAVQAGQGSTDPLQALSGVSWPYWLAGAAVLLSILALVGKHG